uniref:non-ribosomal peptide synthetase n=1 Tax=Nostoc sp. TaxID=1180 RepID=UPI003593C16B
SFRELLARVREVTLGAYAHQDLPLDKLVEELKPERDLSYTPLFQVMFVLQNAPMPPLELEGLTLNLLEFESGTAKFDVTLYVEDTEKGLKGSLEYNTDLFDAASIARMAEHLQTLLEGIVANPNQRLSDLPLLSATELQRLLVEWNDTRADYPKDVCIHELFQAQVERSPDAIAVVFEGEQLTYQQLNCRANQLAHHLQTLEVGPEILVGIHVERSIEMVVGLLGILKAGGAYVPIDPAYPQERLAYILSDSKVSVLLTQKHLVAKLPTHQTRVFCFDVDWKLIFQESEENLVSKVQSKNLAYVIYTSGSTGKPKGVLVTHQNLVQSTCARLCYYNEPVTRFLLVSSFAFDSSVAGIFWTLCQGGILQLPQHNAQQDPLKLSQLIAQTHVSHLLTIPSLYAQILAQALPQQLVWMRTVIVAGEPCPRDMIGLHGERLPHTSLFNEYGPTEATVWSSVYKCRSQEQTIHTSIGRPIINTQIYILDSYLQPVPIGVAGELHIGGVGLARGYLNHPELTQAKFIPNPFSDELGTRLYKTGDLARYLPDGNIEFLGRIDNQVKIHGFRIEPREIEAVMLQHPKVQETIVIAREDQPGNKRLVAYVVLNQEFTSITSNLRRFLQKQLPDYMIPSTFVVLEALPLTPNGKVDCRALPAPSQARSELEETFVPPRTPLEEVLAGIWAEILKLERVGVYDNFFELGGHSLLATQVISRVRKAFQVELPLNQLFELPTVADIAEAIEKLKENNTKLQTPIIVPVFREAGRMKLSSLIKKDQ